MVETRKGNSVLASLKNTSPKNLIEALNILKNNLEHQILADIKKIPAHEMIKYHTGLGRAIRNEWGLWAADSELFKYFRGLGIWHADDMSGIILTSLWRNLNNCFIDLDEQVESYKEYWRKHGKN